MANLQRHHRRIRRKARLIHWGLAPLALAAFPALIVRDLVKVGHEASGATAHRHLRHARHGYGAIDQKHRRHVRWAPIQIVAVTVAVAGWIAWQAHATTR